MNEAAEQTGMSIAALKVSTHRGIKAESLKRGIASVPAPSGQESTLITRPREGFNGIEHNFLDLLERNGIKMHDLTRPPFEPELQQAMDEQPSADHEPGTVLQAWTTGWTLNGKLLRLAMVVVSTAPRVTTPSPTKAAFASICFLARSSRVCDTAIEGA